LMSLVMELVLLPWTCSAHAHTFGPDKCCFQFIKERLPKTKVLSFEYTDKRCAMEGVLLRMLKGKQICADPTMQWVKRIMKLNCRNLLKT
uniref:C-C motif chemokine n=1 Tax=Amphilophus citrinellus TaxID=61819 RepID=A0A3Q0SDU2_AMPCI